MLLSREVQVPSDLGTPQSICFLLYSFALAKILSLSPCILPYLLYFCFYLFIYFGCKSGPRKGKCLAGNILWPPLPSIHTHTLFSWSTSREFLLERGGGGGTQGLEKEKNMERGKNRDQNQYIILDISKCPVFVQKCWKVPFLEISRVISVGRSEKRD